MHFVIILYYHHHHKLEHKLNLIYHQIIGIFQNQKSLILENIAPKESNIMTQAYIVKFSHSLEKKLVPEEELHSLLHAIQRLHIL